MSSININFKVSRNDAGLFITSIENLIQHTGNKAVRVKLIRILREIKFDYWKDDKINHFVVVGLAPVSLGKVYFSSHLRNQLSIDDIWIKTSLHLVCNNIIAKLKALSSLNKSVKPVTPTEAYKCLTVKDVVELIRKKYDDAQ